MNYWRGDKTWQPLNQAAVDGLKATDSPTFANVTVGDGNSADNDVLLKFFIDRAWQFEVEGDGVPTALVLRALSGAKHFRIQSPDGTNLVDFYQSDTDADQYVQFSGRVQCLTGFLGEYQTQSGAWANPSGAVANGRIVTVYNSSAGASRLYVYSNGAWHYTALT